MSQAAKEVDVVIGVDIHMVTLPPPATAPVPLPHPFVGVVYDPIGGFIGAVLAKFTRRWPGLHQRHATRRAPARPSRAQHHVPTPARHLVRAERRPRQRRHRSCRAARPCTSPAPPRPAAARWSRAATSRSTSHLDAASPSPSGNPVIVGGPDAMDWQAAITHGIRTKWFSDKLHSAAQARARS